MTSELESKLDEDYLFYLGFTNSFLQRITDPDVKHKCESWLHKLIEEPCYGTHRKRCRNIYLSQLLIYMQSGSLDGPFLLAPHLVDIENAMDVFQPIPKELVEPPTWLSEVDGMPAKERDPKKGRTIIATRTLPDGQGAFAYIGISLSDDDQMWMGGGEGGLESHLARKFRDKVPPVYEMEKILAKRRCPKERERVLTFFDVLLQNIADEMDGMVEAETNATVNGLLKQVINDLKENGNYGAYEQMDEVRRRKHLLILLHDRVKNRRDKVAKREEVLDELEEKILPKSFFETSVLAEDKFELPAAMWEQAINKAPSKKNMEKLYDSYPLPLVEKFLVLLSDQKEEIAVVMQKRHENIVAQMRKELRKEGEKGKRSLEEVQREFELAMEVLQSVKDAYKKKVDSDKQIENMLKGIKDSNEHSRLYDEMRAAIFDTQRSVEQEAERGRALAAQINAISEQTEQFQQVNDDSIRKTEEANMTTMKNIRRLRMAIKQYEIRVQQIQEIGKNQTAPGSQMFFF